MRLFEVVFSDGVSRIRFSDSAENLERKLKCQGFFNFTIFQIVIT